jgi:hypothetical protein
LREIGADLAGAFRASQAGAVRRGLTLEDGTLVVTDNYMKVRIPRGVARNERVLVRIDEGGATGRVVTEDSSLPHDHRQPLAWGRGPG